MSGFKFLVAVASAATVIGGMGMAQGEGFTRLPRPEVATDTMLKSATDVMARTSRPSLVARQIDANDPAADVTASKDRARSALIR